MANFQSTHYITLLGDAESPAALTWTGTANTASSQPVIDVGNDGVLTENADSYLTQPFKYSGWYITVDGKNFGIFEWNGIFVIPYNATQTNLGTTPRPAALTANRTTHRDDTLANAANCFLTGTRIATPDGERAIETLAPGDLVLTADGRATPVVWVWTQAITNIAGLGEARTPVRVAAHALGPGCPARDLIVTADHALMVDGYLINAGALVNGTTIAPLPLSAMPARFAYWHIETAAHEALVAEGCPAESFVDYVPRARFDNHAAYLAHHGADRVIPEMAVPRISTPRLLPPSLRQRLGIGRAA